MTTEESEDAKMRALFGEMPRPPMGDEEFVSRVMGRVAEAKAQRQVQRNVAVLSAGAFSVALLWPFRDALGAGMTLPFASLTAQLPALSGSAGALLIAAAASLAAWAYAERG